MLIKKKKYISLGGIKKLDHTPFAHCTPVCTPLMICPSCPISVRLIRMKVQLRSGFSWFCMVLRIIALHTGLHIWATYIRTEPRRLGWSPCRTCCLPSRCTFPRVGFWWGCWWPSCLPLNCSGCPQRSGRSPCRPSATCHEETFRVRSLVQYQSSQLAEVKYDNWHLLAINISTQYKTESCFLLKRYQISCFEGTSRLYCTWTLFNTS